MKAYRRICKHTMPDSVCSIQPVEELLKSLLVTGTKFPPAQ
jgi:hypothetical protein